MNEVQDLYRFRKLLLGLTILVMMIISIYQYSWSLFAFAISKDLKWDLATMGLAFTVFAYAATFIQPLSGYIADSFGPRKVSIIAAILVGWGFILSSFTQSPWQLYVFYGLGSLGVGILYGLSTASAIKWFPDKRGLATGAVVFGFGAGTALFNWLIQNSLDLYGFRPTLKFTGFLMLIFLLPAAFFYKYPPDQWSASPAGSKNKKTNPADDFRPLEMLHTYQWYLIYFCFAFTVSIVLIFGAQMKMLAKEYNLPKNYFNWLMVIFPLGNGLSRIVSGAISDKMGREKTMVFFYALLGLSILALLKFGNFPLAFLILVFVAALLGGAPFALYPATVGDYYGARYSTVNYGITYTAKAWAGLISGWLSGYFVTQSGSYQTPLTLVAIGSLVAAFFSNPKLMKKPLKEQK